MYFDFFGVFRMRVFGMIAVFALCMVPVLPAVGQESEGYVVQVEGRLVFIDKGSQDNVYPDNLYQVVRQETIIHPVTGENLGGQVPLGAVRVVEVFPRLSTAEVVDLVRGMDLEMLDKEAKQGKIRIRPLPEEMEETMKKQMEVEPGMQPMRAAMGGSPDGPVRSLVPDLRLGFGSRVVTAFPDTVFKLIPQGLRGQAEADSINRPLENINGSNDVAFSLLMPFSERFSAIADVQMGSSSLFAIGGRYYPGPVLGFLGEGQTPDGEVGEPVVTLKVGTGGRGSSSLPVAVESQIVASSALQADSLFISTLDTSQVVFADSLFQAGVTTTLRTGARDSLNAISKRGTGFAFGLSLALSQRFSFRTGLRRFGNIREFSGGLTYYMKPAEPGGPGTNPDGAIRSLILALDATRDTKGKKTYMNLNLTYPLAPTYTLAAGFLTDMSSFNRIGLSLKGYLKGF